MAQSPTERLEQRLAAYPKDALHYFEGGFAIVGTLSVESRQEIFDDFKRSFEGGSRRVSAARIKKIIGLPERDCEKVGSIYSIVIGLLSDTEATPEQFVQAAQGILFPPTDSQAARSLAELVCSSRSDVSSSIKKAQLAGEVLPSLSDFDVTVDVRIKIIDEKIKTFVPVAILHIDTDSHGQEMWLQLGREDLTEIIEKLQKAVKDINIAEGLSWD